MKPLKRYGKLKPGSKPRLALRGKPKVVKKLIKAAMLAQRP